MKRVVSIFCLMSLLLSLAACGETDPVDIGETTTAEPVETNALTGSGLEVMDWGGKTFTVPTSKPSNLSFQNFEVDAEMENGDILNDAVYNRNRTPEELLNVKITESVLETR